MTSVLVTGAGGYLGGRIVADLAALGDPVVALSRRPAPWLAGRPLTADLADGALGSALSGVDTVVHLAGPNEVAVAAAPEQAGAAAVSAARAVAGAAVAAGVRRLVYLSSVRVYGAALAPGALVSEASSPEPDHPYGRSRLACERTLADVGGDMELVVYRVTNSVGAPADPRVDRWSLVANDLCRQAVTSGSLRLQSDGRQWRDFVALADVLTATRHAVAGRVPAGTYNLGSGTPTTVRDLAELVVAAGAATGRAPELLAPDPSGPADAAYTVDVSRLRATGWAPATGLPDAVAEVWAFCAAHAAELAA